MSLTFQLSIRPNVSPAVRRRIHSDAALIADGMDLMTPHQAVHIRPALAASLARAAVRHGMGVEAAARIGGGL